MWAGIALLAAGYYLTGKLGLIMAIPPGYATAFWPASGVAVAGLLLCGYHVWPGVMLGSFLLNITVGFDRTSGSAIFLSLALPVGIGAGAALQGVAGAWLVRRYVGFPNPLNREQDIASLMVLAGPVSSVINATLGTSLLLLLGRIQASEFAFNFWVWWVGDTIGAFLVTPLVLLWASRSGADWPRRPLTVSLPLALVATLVVGLFVYTDRREQDRIRAAFVFQTESLARALESRLDRIVEAQYSMRAFHGDRPGQADRNRFMKLAEATLKRRPAIHAFVWAPRVKDFERPDFERASKKEADPDFAIRELNGQRQIVTATQRAEYYPVLYRQPAPEIRAVYGFDVASEPDRRAALLKAAETAEPIASLPIPGTHSFADEKFILVILPIYQGGDPPDGTEHRLSAVLGYVVTVLQVRPLVDIAWHGFKSEGIDFWLYDEAAPSEKRLALYRRDSGRDEESMPIEDARKFGPGLERTTTVRGAGRQWSLRFAQTPQYAAANRSLQAWTVLAGGMLLTGLLGGFLFVTTGRSALVTGLVDERTAELARANASMAQEIIERQRVEDSLRSREELLRLSEERFRLLVEGTPDYAIFMLDPRGAIVSWNAGAERINGYRADEIIGQHFSRFFTDDDIENGRPESALATAQAEGRFEDEGWRVRKGGATFWANGIVTALRDESGGLRGFLKITRDITERKQAAEALAANEERFRVLTQSINDAVVSADADGRIIFWNKSAERIFGFGEAEVLGEPLTILMPESYQEAHRNGLAHLQATGEARLLGKVVELIGRRKDGGEFPLELSLAAWETGQGKFYSGIIRDISARKQAEAALDESRRFIERIAAMMPNILFVYDLQEQRNVFVNQRFESILGYAAEETKQPGTRILVDNFHPDDLPKLEWASERYQSADDDDVVEIEYRMRHANGDWRWLRSRNMIFVRDAEGNPCQILGTTQDVTERKRLETEVLEIAAREQRRIGQELHDGTGQELTGLCMLADNLAEGIRENAPEESQLAQRIAHGLRQSLTRIRALSRGLIPVEVDAEGLMAALSELTSRIAEMHLVHCVFECLEPVPVEDNNTATQLYRIAQEAINNALKHAQAANIRVSLEARDYYLTLKVTDDGIGLSQDGNPREGMGLRIMQYRASQIGAQFSVRPGSTRGTVVTCTFFRGILHD